ncbi:MAG: thioredoxin family protein [Chitinophagales bacterium]|nr:thioredoxin family protein [Chitinophagales bacterium]MCO5280909.1 thioredoxin family protein [Chitinophagales bacterium]OJV27544.1 MAG: hypothetical protein BGO32_02915 [Bacteroidetes bacterium 37-13]
MKQFSILVLTIFLLGNTFATASNSNTAKATETGIQFQNITFAQALQKAKHDKKLIFLNVYATWCAPCMSLQKTTFKSAKVGEVFNKNFINLSIDAEKGEGVGISQRYQVTAHPLMLVINGEGKVVKRILGYVNNEQLFSEMKSYIK